MRVSGRRLLSDRAPRVTVGGADARVVSARADAVVFQVPSGLDGGALPVRAGDVDTGPTLHVGRVVATGLHQVDNPAVDGRGRLYLTYSGARGQDVPVSIFRVAPETARESYSSAVINPTSMALSPDGHLYVSSRFEGTVYRIGEDGSATPVVTDAGVACGLAFAADGTLFIGDRSGTILRAHDDGRVTAVATLPPSIAAFHLAMGPDGWLYVTAPTLGSVDHVYRVHPDGRVEVVFTGMGRPQGLAFDGTGQLFVVDALAGASGLFRVLRGGPAELAVAGEGLVGVAFDPTGGFILVSNDTAYRFDGDL